MQHWLQTAAKLRQQSETGLLLSCGCGIVHQGMSSIHHDPRFRIDVLQQDRAGSCWLACRNRNLGSRGESEKIQLTKYNILPPPSQGPGQREPEWGWCWRWWECEMCDAGKSKLCRHPGHETEQRIVSDIWLEEMLPLRTFCRLWQIFKFNVKHSKEHEMKSFLVSWPISTLIRAFYQRHADTEESDIKYQTGFRHSEIFYFPRPVSLAPAPGLSWISITFYILLLVLGVLGHPTLWQRH